MKQKLYVWYNDPRVGAEVHLVATERGNLLQFACGDEQGAQV